MCINCRCVLRIINRSALNHVDYGRTYSKSMVQSGKVANPACGQLNRENEHFPVRVVRA